MSVAVPSSASVFGHRAFACYWGGRIVSILSFQMLMVAIGWQLYSLTGSALDLGLLGLAQFVPMLVLTLLTVSIGGLVQIVPLFTIESTIERVEGVRPYSPLELAGRNIYLREGCYLCHSQQVRPFKDEVERYGHYSLAAESLYDHPFQWGSKRTGPDLARVGGRYSNDWHVAHLASPRAVVPESIMPAYPFLAERRLEYGDIADHVHLLAAWLNPR